jgi:hypothetical protein
MYVFPIEAEHFPKIILFVEGTCIAYKQWKKTHEHLKLINISSIVIYFFFVLVTSPLCIIFKTQIFKT